MVYLVDRLLFVVVYGFLMVVYFPIYILANLTIRKNLLLLKLQKFLRFRVKQSRLGLISRKSRITDVVQVSTDEEIDFQQNRSSAYVHRMTIWTPLEIVKMVQRQQTIELISDEQLAYIILSTVYAHSVCWDEDRKMYRLKMEGFEDLCLFEGFYWDARHVFVSPDVKKIVIQMDDGNEYSSDASSPTGKADYNLAKLHVQVCLSYFAPGLSHNHVHFVFPSAICVLSKTKLKRSGVLYKLLSPHFRFTERINYQALRVGKATNNKRSQIDRLFFFWQPFPVTKEQFMEGVARKCKKHYMDTPSVVTPQSTPATKLNGHTSNNGTSPPTYSGEDETTVRKHVLFPPDYVTDPNLQKIPYLAFLREYYLVIRKFVKSTEAFIDRSEWEELSRAVAVHVPKFDEVDMVEAISTFIHQVGVVHFCDHKSYLRYFAYRYGCMAIRSPFESFRNTEYWKEKAIELRLSVETIKKNPLLLIRQRDVMRTRCFLNLFVDYIPNPKCDLTLITTDYKFDHHAAEQAASNFISHLRALDGKLKTRVPPIEIPRKAQDVRPPGSQICRLDDIVRTVCF